MIENFESLALRVTASVVRNVSAEWHIYVSLLVALSIGYIAAMRRRTSPFTVVRAKSFRVDATYAAIELLHLSHYFVIVPLTAGVSWFVATHLPWIRISSLSALPTLVQGLLFFVIIDFWTYWYHRIQHTVPLFWQFHKTHHSQEQLSPLTVFRVTLLDRGVAIVMFALPIAVLDVSYTIPLAILVGLQFHQLIIHSDIGWTFGPFRNLLVSPSFHEVHHSTAPEHLNRNYGAVLAVWDHLFTTHAERKHKFLLYGLVSEKLPESYVGQFFVPLKGVWRLTLQWRKKLTHPIFD